jgi:hypothetical protein
MQDSFVHCSQNTTRLFTIPRTRAESNRDPVLQISRGGEGSSKTGRYYFVKGESGFLPLSRRKSESPSLREPGERCMGRNWVSECAKSTAQRIGDAPFWTEKLEGMSGIGDRIVGSGNDVSFHRRRSTARA